MRLKSVTASSFLAAILAVIFAISSTTVLAADSNIVGVWGLVSLSAEDAQSTVIHQYIWGEHPIGLLTYSAGGHMSAVLTAEGRKPMSGMGDKRLEESAQMFITMTSYAGTYSVNGDTVTHHVEVAGDPSWVGKDQVRLVKFENGTLTVTAPSMSNSADGKSYKIIAVWKQLE